MLFKFAKLWLWLVTTRRNNVNRWWWRESWISGFVSSGSSATTLSRAVGLSIQNYDIIFVIHSCKKEVVRFMEQLCRAEQCSLNSLSNYKAHASIVRNQTRLNSRYDVTIRTHNLLLSRNCRFSLWTTSSRQSRQRRYGAGQETFRNLLAIRVDLIRS